MDRYLINSAAASNNETLDILIIIELFKAQKLLFQFPSTLDFFTRS